MKVQVLSHTYLNNRYLTRKSHDEYLSSKNEEYDGRELAKKNEPLMKHVNLETFTPVAFSGFGTTMIRTLRKVILDEVPVFAVKSSMDLVNYEQVDKNGNTYLHDSYSKYYRIEDQFDTFQNDVKRQEYLNKSGFAKIVVVDEEGKRVYNGDEHTQVLTDRWGFLPVDSNLSYFLDVKRTPPVKVPLDQIWFFIGKVKGNVDRLRSINQIEPIEFGGGDATGSGGVATTVGSRIYHLTVSNSVLAFYYDFDEQSQPVWYNLTSQVVPKYNERGEAIGSEEQGGLFPYDTLLLSLKPGQRVLAHCRLEEGVGRRYAKWMPGIVRYKFATARDMSESGSGSRSRPETNDEQRQYLVAGKDLDPKGLNVLLGHVFANEPETIILTLQSIGRLQVPMILDRAFTTIKVWLRNFRNGLLDLSRFYNVQKDQLRSFIAESLTVRVESYTYPELILQVDNCHGSYLPLIVDSLLRSLVVTVSNGGVTSSPKTPLSDGVGVGVGDGVGVDDNSRKRALKALSDMLEHHRRLTDSKRDSVFDRDNTEKEKIVPMNKDELQTIQELEKWNRDRQAEVASLIEKTQTSESLKDKLIEYRLHQPNFEEDWIATQKLTFPSISEQTSRLLGLLEQTVISQRIRHPLRTESYLTLKYPDVLLNQIDESEVKQYFCQGEYGDFKDINLVNFYRILTLTLRFLEDLDKKIDTLSYLVRTAFNSGGALSQSRLPLQHASRADFDYRTLLQQKIVYQYNDLTKLTIPYYGNQLHSGIPVRGQRKLFLTEVFFLSKFLTKETESEYLVIYAGAADGSHQTILHEMFPKLKFVLFDPAFANVYKTYQDNRHAPVAKIFTLGPKKLVMYGPEHFGNVSRPQLTDAVHFNSQHSYHIFPCYCTPQIVPSLVKLAGDRKILFISDLRVIPTRTDGMSDEIFERETQRQVYQDNYMQYQLVKTLNQSGKLEAAMVKFRFPYKHTIPYIKLESSGIAMSGGGSGGASATNPTNISESQLLQANQFYRGEVYVQPYAPASTTESRLIIGPEVLKSREPLMTYDDVKYEQFFSYINNVVRRSMKFWTPGLSRNWNRNYDLNHKYDHLLELLILNKYLVKYQSDRQTADTHMLDLLADLLAKVETDSTMQTIKWQGTI